MAGEEPVHLFRRPDVELIAAVAHAVLVVAASSPVLMHSSTSWALASSCAEVMGVAGGDQRQAEPVGDRRSPPRRTASLDVQAVVLDLDVEILAEEPGEPFGQLLRLVQLVLEDELAELARGAAAQADDAFLVGLQQFLVDARDVVVAFQVRRRRPS